MAWINEANWPEAWVEIYFSPIVKSGSDYIVYATGYGVLKLYKYNLTTQTWTYLNTTPAQLYTAISLSPDGTKLAFHGVNTNRLYIYNIAGNSWTTSAAAPNFSVTGEVAEIQTTVWTDNDTIWCHIRGAASPYRNKCYKYVVSTNTWAQYTNVYALGPYNSSKNMSVNSAGTALFVGSVFDGTDRTKGFKYVIATDTYSLFLLTGHGIGGYDYNVNSDRAARLWFIDALTTYLGTYYYNCDTESCEDYSPGARIFPNDPLRDKISQNLACGIYATGYIIAWHKTTEPKNRSYLGTLPPSSPSVTTNDATNVIAHSAIPNGILDNDGGEACACGFQWGETIAYGNTTPTQSRTTGQTFAQTIVGLDPNKTYHFRAFATNSAGTSYGSDRTFSTLTTLAQVQTLAATGVAEAHAQLNGMVVDDAGVPGDVSFEWGITTAYGQETPWLSGYSSGAMFWALIYPLAPGTAYHFRARFRNGYGVVYGVDMAFATLSAQGIAVLIDDAALLRSLEVV